MGHVHVLSCILHKFEIQPATDVLNQQHYMLQTGEGVTYHPAPLLRRSGFPQRKDVATDGDFPPLARLGVLAEAVARVHDQNAVGGQSVHLAVLHPPLGRLLLHTARQFTFS